MPFPGHLVFPCDNYSFSTQSGPGACAALCVRWLRAMHENPIAATWTSPFLPGVMGTQQQIEQTQATYESSNHDNNEELNILRPNRLKVTRRGQFLSDQDRIRDFLTACFVDSGSYYISLEGQDYQHNIAIYTGVNGYLIFDPNGGAYRSGGQPEFVSSHRYWYAEYDPSYPEIQWYQCELLI